MITLYDYWRSSAAYRVRIALNLLGLPYNSVQVNLLTGDHLGAENLRRNPQGLVPTIEIDGLCLTQSLGILEYLHETRGGLLPDDAAGRARVRALSYAIAMEVAPVCNLSIRRQVESLSGGAIAAEDWQRLIMTKGLSAFDRMLDHPATGLCCHGDAVTMADLCLVPLIYNAERVGIDVTSFPKVTKAMAHLTQLPPIAAAHPDKVKP